MAATKQATKSEISLKGSAAMVAEFFGFSINSILYQRGVYEPDSFKQVERYGLKLHVSADEGLNDYLKKVLGQLGEWLAAGQVRQLVLVISSVDTQSTLERWTFNVDTDKEVLAEASAGGPAVRTKDERTVRKEISVIIRQIVSSVSFLPLLEEACSFDLLVYTQSGCETPVAWEESDPKYINNSSEVKLHSFNTSVHRVEPSVTYKTAEDSSDDEDDAKAQ